LGIINRIENDAGSPSGSVTSNRGFTPCRVRHFEVVAIPRRRQITLNVFIDSQCAGIGRVSAKKSTVASALADFQGATLCICQGEYACSLSQSDAIVKLCLQFCL